MLCVALLKLVIICFKPAVSLAFFGSAAAETCRNGTRPASVNVQVSFITKKHVLCWFINKSKDSVYSPGLSN